MSLILHLKMDDNAASATVVDATGNVNGTYKDGGGNINTSTGSVVGKIDNALDFDGDEYVECANVAVLDDPAAITVAAWVKTAVAGDNRIGASRDAGAPNYGWYLYMASATGYPTFAMDTTAGAGAATGDVDVADSKWHHVVGTWDGATVMAYVDGVPGTSASHGGTISKNVVTRFGRGTQTTQYHTGQLDDVRIYSTALSISDVKDVYEIGAITRNTNPVVVRGPNLQVSESPLIVKSIKWVGTQVDSIVQNDDLLIKDKAGGNALIECRAQEATPNQQAFSRDYGDGKVFPKGFYVDKLDGGVLQVFLK